VRTPSHLTHKTLLLHLAAELAQRLFELFGILDDDSHGPTRIQVEPKGRAVTVTRGQQSLARL